MDQGCPHFGHVVKKSLAATVPHCPLCGERLDAPRISAIDGCDRPATTASWVYGALTVLLYNLYHSLHLVS